MRRFGLLAMVLVTAAAAGCGGGDGGDDGGDPVSGPAGTTTVPAPTTVPGTTLAPTSLTLRITDVRLVNSEESDNGMRVLLPAGAATASVTLTGVPTPNHVIAVCQANELDSRLSGATCRTPANGEAVTVALGAAASGVEVVQVGVAGSGPTGNAATLEEVAIRYSASSRELNARFPQIAAGDAGGRTTFGLTPASADGAYRATLMWSVIAVFGGTPSNGQLELLQGGSVTSQTQGSGQVELSGAVPPPVGDVAIRVQNLGSSALVSPKLSVLLP